MIPKHEEEASLLALIAQGDQSAAEVFDARFRPKLLRFVRGRVHRDHEDDLAQETLQAAFHAIKNGDFNGRSALGTWLVGILKHKLSDYWAAQKRERNTAVTVFSEAGSQVDAVADPGSDPNLRIEVDQLLRALPKLHRAVLLLNVREGLNTDQIAAATKLPSGTVGRILWEAKRILRKQRDLKKLPPKTDQ